MIPITFADLEKEIRRLATEAPDNVYISPDEGPCYYNKGICTDGTIGCIFGQAFRNLGISLPLEDDDDGRLPIVCLLKRLAINPSGRDSYFAAVIQNAQDNCCPWGEAVSRADRWVGQ